MFLPMSKLKLLLTGLAFAYKQLLVFMHMAQYLVALSYILFVPPHPARYGYFEYNDESDS